MNGPQDDYGLANSVDAEAVGQPGQRTFRLLVSASGRTACVWMEKQQLAGIGTWLEEMCDRLDKERSATPDIAPDPISVIYDLEFRASQVALGYAEAEEQFVIQAFDPETLSGTIAEPRFRFQLGRGQARVLARKIESVVSAGRPICPLCNMPMDPAGHVCPKSNGHSAPATV